MNFGRAVFPELIEFLPHREFQKCVAHFGGDRYLKNRSCWNQYLAMAFAQLTYRENLRDIEACMGTVVGKLYHMPLPVPVGQVSQPQSRRQHAQPAGYARQLTRVYSHYRWQDTRRKYSRRDRVAP